jgi:hypothetical protein
MRGCGRAATFLAATVLFAAACTLGGGTSNPTANISPESSPSSSTGSTNNNTGSTSSPPAASPSSAASPSAAALAITSLPVHNGEVGVGYLAVSFQATGGTAPYTWAIADGTIPPGLTLSAGGVLTGNDSKAGTFNFSVKVTDSAGQAATGPTSIKVFQALSVSQPCSSACNVGLGCTTCGRFGTVTGGAGPYQYKVVGGAIPTGMSLNGFALGGPWPLPPVTNARPVLSLAVSVTDDFGVTKTVSANWIEFGPIQTPCTVGIQCTSIGTNGVPDTDVTYFGGNPTDSVTVSVTQVCNLNGSSTCITDAAGIAGALPPNWTATAKAGTVTVSMDCAKSPTCPNGNYYADVYIVLVDHGACVAPAYVQSTPVLVNVDV